MKTIVLFVLCYIALTLAGPNYYIGEMGQSCAATCIAQGMNCNPHIVTNNSTSIFNQLGISCTPDTSPWWAPDQPSYVANASDPDYQKCVGYIDVPGGVFCGGSYPTTRRLCRCDPPSNNDTTFGYGYSGGTATQVETILFQHFLAPGDLGVMTHLWTTSPQGVDPGLIIRYYIDGEAQASIQFQPALACGVGFADTQAPWGTQWFGKGAADSGWFWNFKVPFTKSIIVTFQHPAGNAGGFYIIIRGGSNLPINIGGLPIPNTAVLRQFITSATFQPIEWVPIVNISSGSGVHFMHTISVSSGNLNFLEGCYHMYQNGQDFPGTVLSTGTEDYFDSGWYFNAGEFHLPVSGFTHYNGTGGVTWSAYRFHEMDPLQFTNGFQFVWRNGDVLDRSGIKCNMETAAGGTIVGSPTASQVTAYAWVYTW